MVRAVRVPARVAGPRHSRELQAQSRVAARVASPRQSGEFQCQGRLFQRPRCAHRVWRATGDRASLTSNRRQQ